MAFLVASNISIKGLSCCVPDHVVENTDFDLISAEDVQKFVNSTGVERRHIVRDGQCASDLCFAAAEKLLTDLKWEKEDVDCLIFVSQTPDYILPATSYVLHKRLQLAENCYCLDISLGCSGWIYGLSVITSLMNGGTMKRGLLLVGDATSRTVSPRDKATTMLFGDAGTATALEYDLNARSIQFSMSSDGSGYEAIIIPEGGYRNPFNSHTLDLIKYEEGIERDGLHCILSGMDVFSFGISKAPQSVNQLCERFSIDKDLVDFFYFHQANLFMNEKIRKKLKLPEGKVPYSLRDFGNTSCASIPQTMVTQTANLLRNEKQRIIACGFGVGLSWGTVYFETDKIVVPQLIKI